MEIIVPWLDLTIFNNPAKLQNSFKNERCLFSHRIESAHKTTFKTVQSFRNNECKKIAAFSFPSTIFSVNVTKSAVSCKFGHIYWRNPLCKTSFFVQCFRSFLVVYFNKYSFVINKTLLFVFVTELVHKI